MNDLARQLAWSGVKAEPRALGGSSVPVAKQLIEAATEITADLLVAGGFGRSPLREQVFGGVTRHLLDGASLPVLLAH